MSTSGTVPVDPTAKQFVGTEISSICSMLARPAILTGMFRDILTRHFADASYIEDSNLRKLIWTSGNDTGILIESIHRWRPQITQRCPAVIIKRGAYQNRRLGLGGERHQGPSSDIYGTAHYTTSWVGSHTLFCIGGNGSQTELLATEVQRELHHFGQIICENALLLRFGVVEVGEMTLLKEWEEHFVVPVTCGYVYEDSWRIRQQAPILNRILLSTILEG